MRVNAGFSRLLRLDGIWVRGVRFQTDRVVVSVALRRRRLRCPLCAYSTPHRHNRQQVESTWRHLDLGVWRLELRAQLRRLECPEHGVRVESVPFARHASGFTRDFEQLVAWLATRTDKTTVKRLVRVDWDTVGRIIARVCADELDPDRLHNLFEIGIDEVSWRRQHRYLTLVADHIRGQIVWGTEGNDSAAADRFFTELGKSRAGAIEVISLEMGPGYAKSAREHAPQAIIAIDPYHVVALANRALDDVRRAYWNELRRVGDRDAARRFKDARWSLLKAPENLTDNQATTLRRLRRAGHHGVARLHPQGSPARDLRTRPDCRRRDDPDRPVHQQGGTEPTGAIRAARADDPSPPRRDPPSDPPRDQPRTHRSPEQQGPPDHAPRLRIPQRESRARARDAQLRTDRPPPTARVTPRVTDSHLHPCRESLIYTIRPPVSRQVGVPRAVARDDLDREYANNGAGFHRARGTRRPHHRRIHNASSTARRSAAASAGELVARLHPAVGAPARIADRARIVPETDASLGSAPPGWPAVPEIPRTRRFAIATTRPATTP
jgi:transposase